MNKKYTELANIKPEHIGINAINPAARHNSPSRQQMVSASHLPQSITPDNGEENIFQSGIELRIGEKTLRKEVINDSEIIAIVPKNKLGITTHTTMVIWDRVLRRYDIVELPRFSEYHPHFGFRYKYNNNVMVNLTKGAVIKGGTVIADSPAIKENGGYAYGANLNVWFSSDNDVSEDAVIMSRRGVEKFKFRVLEKRVFEVGKDSILINLYGDENNYKPLPDIGSKVHPSGLVGVVRPISEDFPAVLYSAKGLMEYDYIFDKLVYTRDGNGVVVDIEVDHNVKIKPSLEGVFDNIQEHANATQFYYKALIEVNDEIYKDWYRRGLSNSSPDMSPPLIDAISNAMKHDQANRQNSKMKKEYASSNLDTYRIIVKIEHYLTPGIGYKITDLNGGKGIICEVRDDEDMPRSEDGEIVDMIAYFGSTISRMNIARYYQPYIGATSRVVKKMVTELVHLQVDNVNKLSIHHDLNTIYSPIVEYLSYLETPQYHAYKNATNYEMLEIIKETVVKEFYIHYQVSDKPLYMIVDELKKTKFRPHKGSIWFKKDDGRWVKSKEPAIIGPIYMILLAKIADTWLATSSPKLNNLGLPTVASNGSKHRTPYKDSPVKYQSETEARLFVSYADSPALAIEMKNRAGSLSAHRSIYSKILNTDGKLMTIENLVDREHGDFALERGNEVFTHIARATGVGLEYKYVDNINRDLSIKPSHIANTHHTGYIKHNNGKTSIEWNFEEDEEEYEDE